MENKAMPDPRPDSQNNEIAQFSFWKPEPIPPKNASILPIELLSLGRMESVADKLLDVPHMAKVQPLPWEAEAATQSLNLFWEVDEGVILKVRAEQGPPKPGEVLTINARSAAGQKTF